MTIEFASQYTDNFPRLLKMIGGSLLISTYQAGQLVLLRSDGKSINTHFLGMEKPMGLTFKNGCIAIGSGARVWEYRAMPMVAPKIEPHGTHDNCYLPRKMHLTGDIDIHEMAFTNDDKLWMVNTKMSCLCTLDGEHSVVPQWQPPFISGYDLTDRCHLNGMSLRDGKPRYVTALGETDSAAGWRENKANGGILMDIEDNRMIARGLSMPHSPRWHQNRLLVLESGEGSLCEIDQASGEKSTIAQMPGFTRGIDFAAQVAFIGLSEVRETAVFAGLPLTRRVDDRKCGVWAVDTTNGQVLAYLKFTGSVREIFSVQVLPDRFPILLEPDNPMVRSSYALPNEVLKKVIAPPAQQVQVEQAQHAAINKDYTKATGILRELLSEDPQHKQAQLMLGIVLTDAEQWEEGLIALNRAIELEPDNAEAFNSQGFAFAGLGQFESAVDAFDKAIELDHKYALAYMNRGMMHLKMGNYQQGWRDFEWRWQTPQFHPFQCPQPQWQGEDISDKTLLVHTEQGAGDAIQSARFLEAAALRCKKLILVAPENLRDLLGTAKGVDQARLPGNMPQDLFDVYCPIMSLAGPLGIGLDDLPATRFPYLSVPDHVSARKLEGEGLKIGFVWRGSETMKSNHHRSVQLSDFEGLIKIHGTSWYSLQMPISGAEASWMESHGVTNLEADLPGFARTAALIEQLDLVIGVDTSAIHLSGALNVPTWVVLGQHSDWRWQTDGDETGWYPNTRLFRKGSGEDRQDQFKKIEARLLTQLSG